MMDRLFSYPDRTTAEAVRDALRRIAPAFAIIVGPAGPDDGLSRVRQAGDDDGPVYWIMGDRRLIALFELAGDVFGQGGLIAARTALEGVRDRKDDGLGDTPESAHAREHTAAEIRDALKAAYRDPKWTARDGAHWKHVDHLRTALTLRVALDEVQPRPWPVPIG